MNKLRNVNVAMLLARVVFPAHDFRWGRRRGQAASLHSQMVQHSDQVSDAQEILEKGACVSLVDWCARGPLPG
jgi:hypothetical protein